MIRNFHRAGAVVLGTFVTLHLGNHIWSWAGVASHIQVMEALRLVYRHPVAEAILMLAVTAQLGAGLILAWRGRGLRTDWPARLQLYSGLYLAFFLAQHVTAVWVGRLVQGVDTNFYFAAAVLEAPQVFYFAPYYFLGVLAFFMHVGLGIHYMIRNQSLARTVAIGFSVVGAVVALGIVLTFAGVFYEINFPAGYQWG